MRNRESGRNKHWNSLGSAMNDANDGMLIFGWNKIVQFVHIREGIEVMWMLTCTWGTRSGNGWEGYISIAENKWRLFFTEKISHISSLFSVETKKKKKKN